MKISEGKMNSLSCLLCFQQIKTQGYSEMEEKHPTNHRIDILHSSKRLLSEKITKDCFKGDWTEKPNLFCPHCLHSSADLWKLEENLGKSKQELNNYVRTFTKQIFKCRVIILSKRAEVMVNGKDNFRPEKSDGSDEQSSCLLCFDSIDSEISFSSETAYDCIDYKAVVFQSCCRLLSENVKGDSFNWVYSKEYQSPFCVTCFQSAEKLWKIEEKFSEVKQKLKGCSDMFSKIILQSRVNSQAIESDGVGDTNEFLRKSSFLNNYDVSCNKTVLDSYVSSSSICFSTISEEDCKPQIIIETFKREPEDYFNDFNDVIEHNSLFEEEGVLEDMKVELVEYPDLCSKNSTDVQFKKYGCRELRVSLERLQLNANGKIILPLLSRDVQGRKRKAAIVAAASFCKKTNNNGTAENNAFRDADFELSDYGVDDMESDFDENESKIKRSGNPKRPKNISERFKCRRRPSNTKNSEKVKCPVCENTYLIRYLQHHMRKHTSKVYKCNMCPGLFSTSRKLRIHKIRHNSIEYKVQCEVCYLFFKSDHSLNWHKTVHDEENENQSDSCGEENKKRSDHWDEENKKQCDYCDEWFAYYSDLIAHKITVHDVESPYKCDQCQKMFPRKRNLTHHLKIVHKKPPQSDSGPPYNCGICGKSYKRVENMDYHMWEQHLEPKKISNLKIDADINLPDFCEEDVKYDFDENEGTVKQRKESSEEKEKEPRRIIKPVTRNSFLKVYKGVFTCAVCSSKFSYSQELKNHSKETGHVNERRFKCNVCPKGFYRKVDLNGHYKKYHDATANTDKRTCTICGRVSSTYYLHLHHVRSHSKTKPSEDVTRPLKCKHCEKRFSELDDLKKHFADKHQGVKYNCALCPATFILKTAMAAHKKHHKKAEFKVQCKICYRFYSNQRGLNNHLKFHNEESKLKCQDCDINFEYKFQLISHRITIHGEDSPFQCEKCKVVLSSEQDLNLHLRIIHKRPLVRQKTVQPRPYSCEMCGDSFKSPKTLDKHFRKVHKTKQKVNKVKQTEGKTILQSPSKESEIEATEAHLVNKTRRKRRRVRQKTMQQHPFSCEMCEDSYRSLRGLRIHVRKIHNSKQEVIKVKPTEDTTILPSSSKESPESEIEATEAHLVNETHPPIIAEISQQILETNADSRCSSPTDLTEISHPPSPEPDSPAGFGMEIGTINAEQNSELQEPVTKEKTYKCDHCDKSFPTCSRLREHMAVHNGRTLKCDICPASFVHRNTLKRHKAHHNSSEHKFQCPICLTLFRSEARCNSHQKKIHGEVNKKCDSCDVAFRYFWQLSGHKITVHGANSPFKCGQCGISFPRKRDLNFHMRATHKISKAASTGLDGENGAIKQKICRCEHCDKIFPNRSSLEDHLAVHNGRSLKCGICPASFIHRKTLIQHKAHHNSIDHKFQCQVCYQLYRSEIRFNTHIKIHSETNKKKCDSCDVTFPYLWQLAAHKITFHGANSPFKCGQCGISFPGRRDLNAHMRATHKISKVDPGPPYNCETCGGSYKSFRLLNCHVRTCM